MKLVLFLCLSLFVSLLHAAAMPIANLGNAPMTTETEMAEHHEHQQHVDKMQADHHDSKNHCPGNGYPCCIVLAIYTATLPPVTPAKSEATYASLTASPPQFCPDTLYKPPKFYPV